MKFVKPLGLALIKPNGKHYVVESKDGPIEVDEDMPVYIKVFDIMGLKQLRSDIRNGKYIEMEDTPINDQLWAHLAAISGLLKPPDLFD